jgi:hypothetical protein
MNNIYCSFKAISGVINFNGLPIQQRQITFYSEGKTYWPHLKGLLTDTLERSNKSVCYISSSLDDPGLMVDHPNLNKFFVGMGFVRDYFFQNLETNIMVMTMPDLHNFQVKRSRHKVHYIYVQHSLVSFHMVYKYGAFDHYDTICVAGPHHIDEIRAIEAKYDLPRKNIIELGYSRLDSLIDTSKNYKKINLIKKKSGLKILVAPSWGPKGVVESGLGKTLVRELLNLGHEVIFRPHPQTIKFSQPQVDKIRYEHKDKPNFAFEASVDGQESLHESDIMISDWSGAALEYAFALKKSVIFCDVPRKVNNPNYQDIDIEPLEVSIREEVGVIWDGLSSIGDLVEHCVKNRKTLLNKLTKQYVFNLGRSDRVFSKYIRKLK